MRLPPRSPHFPYTTLFRSGPDHSNPDYTYGSWFAMLFSAGMGIGLMFFSVAEPVMHYVSPPTGQGETIDRKSTRLNSSHVRTSYAVFCLKKKTSLVATRFA